MDDKSTSTDMETSEGLISSPAKSAIQSTALLWGKRVCYRVWRLFAEFGAVAMGVVIAWLYGLSFLLTQQSVDISGANNNVGLFFADVVAGTGVDIPDMKLDWYPATDDIVFTGRNILIKDSQGTPIQSLSELKSFFSLNEVRKGRTIPRKINLDGGVVTWVEDEDGRIKAGLGTPETLGRLGPVWEGQRAVGTESGELDFNGVTSVEVTNASAYYINKHNDLSLSLQNVSLSFDRQKDDVKFKLNADLLDELSAENRPLALQVDTDPDFEHFEVSFNAEAVRPSVFGPKKGRYTDLNRIDAPVSLGGDFVFSRTIGLTSASVDLHVQAGEIHYLNDAKPFAFSDFKAAASLDAGDSIMSVEKFDLNSDLLIFTGRGEISDLGAISDGNINSSPLFELNFNQIRIDPTPIFEAPIRLKAVGLIGRLDIDSRTVSIDDYIIDRSTHSISGKIFASQNSEGKLSAIKADGELNGILLPSELLEIWPVKFADGARRWIERSILEGDVDTLSFETEYGLSAEGELEETSMDMEYTVRDATVQYISTMTPMSGAYGKARVADNALTFELESGQIGPVKILPSRVDIPRLKPKGGDIIITANGEGQASDLMALINQKPFQYADRYGVDPKGIKGTGRVSLTISRPLLEYFDESRIQYSANGEFFGVNAPFSFGPHQFENGNVSMVADRESLSVAGPVNIGPWRAQFKGVETFDEGATPTRYQISGPMDSKVYEAFGFGFREFFDGEIMMDVKAEGTGINITSANVFADLSLAEMSFGEYWNKPSGQAGSVEALLSRGDTGIRIDHLNVEAPKLNISGTMSLNEASALDVLRLDRVMVSDIIDGAFSLKPAMSRNHFEASFTGEKLDISAVVDRSLSQQTSSFSIPVAFQAEVKDFILDPLYRVSNAKLIYDHNGEAVTTLNLIGEHEGEEMSVLLETDLSAKTRRVDVTLPHASKAAKAFLDIDGMDGGFFKLEGTLPLSGEDGAYIGRAVIDDFTLKEAPILAQLLSLGSLTGLFDTLSGEGLAFERFDAPFQLLGGDITIRDAQVFGPALGMTGEGQINLTTRTVDMDGALVPAYTANSMLGGIPLIGDIFVGKEGEGVFALNYSVSGPFEATQIAVNPLSALTPGFLRGIFRKKRDDLPEIEGAKKGSETIGDLDEAPLIQERR